MKKIFSVCLVSLFCIIASAQSDTTLKAFGGKYSFPSGSIIAEVTVYQEGDGLMMSSSMGSSNLTRKDGDLFNVIQFQGTALFNRDANKKVIGVIIDAMGYHLEGTKSSDEILLLSYMLTPSALTFRR